MDTFCSTLCRVPELFTATGVSRRTAVLAATGPHLTASHRGPPTAHMDPQHLPRPPTEAATRERHRHPFSIISARAVSDVQLLPSAGYSFVDGSIKIEAANSSVISVNYLPIYTASSPRRLPISDYIS